MLHLIDEKKLDVAVIPVGVRFIGFPEGTRSPNRRLRPFKKGIFTDPGESYQMLTYTDDVDLNEKLAAWERFDSLDRAHVAFKGKTPYEALRCRLE